jgi:hypothetical protein
MKMILTPMANSGTLHDLIYSVRYAAVRTDAAYLPLEDQLVALLGLF